MAYEGFVKWRTAQAKIKLGAATGHFSSSPGEGPEVGEG